MADARPATPQPLWALVPAAGRARYLRRTATAILDELEDLADVLADTVGQPRTEAILAELLPSVGGLHDLADHGARALRDRRLGRIPALRAGRRSLLVSAPRGTVGIRGGRSSPWVEPVLETGAALLAGNAVVLSTPMGDRVRRAFERGGVPLELIALAAPEDDLAALADHIVDTRPPREKGTMLVLDRAPLDRTATGALWAAFAGGGRHRAAVGRLVVVPSVAEPLIAAVVAGAERLRPGDPREPETEVGPLRSPETRRRVEALVAAAVADGATLLCGGPRELAGVASTFYAPAVLRGVPPDARLLREPVPGPVLAVVEAATEEEAIALAAGGPAVSVWAGDRARGERVARTLGAEVAWVNEHGHSIPGAAVRLAGHVDSRRLASQPTRLRSARWLPYDPALVRASTATARLQHGRENERLGVLRAGAVPLARTAVRLAREALGR
ncbi:MAG: aldehyde dehydrogenase family protein [Solirubrobacteraceae bacterium]